MRKIYFILYLAFMTNTLFSQEVRNLVVEWHAGLWNTDIIAKRYPDWPQMSKVLIEYDGYNIYYTPPNSYRKQLILRNFTATDIINNPSLIKPALLGLSPNNTFVNVFWDGSRNANSFNSRIKGARNPSINYLPNSIKY